MFLLCDADSRERCSGVHERLPAAVCSVAPMAQNVRYRPRSVLCSTNRPGPIRVFEFQNRYPYFSLRCSRTALSCTPLAFWMHQVLAVVDVMGKRRPSTRDTVVRTIRQNLSPCSWSHLVRSASEVAERAL